MFCKLLKINVIYFFYFPLFIGLVSPIDYKKSSPPLGGDVLFLEIQIFLQRFDLSLSLLDAGLVVGGTLESRILHLSIELDLRLST